MRSFERMELVPNARAVREEENAEGRTKRGANRNTDIAAVSIKKTAEILNKIQLNEARMLA